MGLLMARFSIPLYPQYLSGLKNVRVKNFFFGIPEGIPSKILDLKKQFTSVMNGDIDIGLESSIDVGELSALFSVKDFPVRIKCVLLSWSAIDGSM